MVSCNIDSESLRMLPDMDVSIADKVILLRTTGQEVEFPPDVEDVIDAELPSFCRFLMDTEIPKHIAEANRIGMRAYHEPSLLAVASQNSGATDFHELLSMFLESHFKDHPKEDQWEGTSTQLYSDIGDHEHLALILRQEEAGRQVHEVVAQPGLLHRVKTDVDGVEADVRVGRLRRGAPLRGAADAVDQRQGLEQGEG